jgi:hypothetical protein
MAEVDYVRMWKEAVVIYMQVTVYLSVINISYILFYAFYG